jgi:hypothetical protein
MKLNSRIDSPKLALFKKMMRDLSSLIQNSNHDINLFGFSDHSKTWEKFDQYPPEVQDRIFEDFLCYKEICESALNSGGFDNTRMLWAAIKKLGVLPGEDLFGLIDPNDIIEIYRNDGIQVFRNFKFHEICSYEYPELFVYRWDELFDRDNFVTDRIVKDSIKVFTGVHLGTLFLNDMPEHEMKERFSPRMFTMKMRQKFFYPLKNRQGGIPYGIAVSNVRVTGAEKEASPTLFMDL